MKRKKKVALITGGAVGIGAAIARRLSADGFHLHLGYNKSSREFKKLVRELSNSEITVSGTQTDIRYDKQCEKLVNECIEIHMEISALILNAGVFISGSPVDVSTADWENLIETNLSSSVYLLKYAIPQMRKKGGAIIFLGTGSIVDSIPSVDYPCYAASKAGLYVLMRSLAVSEGKYGIRVNMISPGMIDSGGYTPETIRKYSQKVPLGYLGTPGDVAEACAFLLSEKASYISGSNIDISGGWVRRV